MMGAGLDAPQTWEDVIAALITANRKAALSMLRDKASYFWDFQIHLRQW